MKQIFRYESYVRVHMTNGDVKKYNVWYSRYRYTEPEPLTKTYNPRFEEDTKHFWVEKDFDLLKMRSFEQLRIRRMYSPKHTTLRLDDVSLVEVVKEVILEQPSFTKLLDSLPCDELVEYVKDNEVPLIINNKQ